MWIVVQVTEGTPAAQAGLLPADRIRALAGVPITEAANPASSLELPTVDMQIEPQRPDHVAEEIGRPPAAYTASSQGPNCSG